MVKLTPKQENFCLAYLETGNATEAYRRSYPGGKSKPAVISINAFRLLESTKIALRIEELRAPAVAKALCTFDDHLETLANLRDAALGANQFSAAITAEGLRGKASGHYMGKDKESDELPRPTKVEIVVTDARR